MLRALHRAYTHFQQWLTGCVIRTEALNAERAISQIDRSQPVVYVLPNSSWSDRVVLQALCEQHSLPSPDMPVFIGEQALEHALFCLAPNPSWFSLRKQHRTSPKLIKLLALQQSAPASVAVQLVPVSVFWGQAPDKQTSAWKLLFADGWAMTGRLRRFFAILFLGRQTRVQFGTPISLPSLITPSETLRNQRRIQRVLRKQFRHQKTTVIGPDLSHRRTVVKGLLHSSNVRAAVAEQAEHENLPIQKVRAKAEHYAKEIAADFSYPAVRFMDRVLTWFWNRLYDGIEAGNTQHLPEQLAGYEVVYVPCHRSHIDYLLLSYLLVYQGLSAPHIAAGVNLNIPLVGGLLRRCGAFFMRRTFKDNPLYATVFNEYLHTLLKQGFAVEYFIEGGRSRTGRMLPPKNGMLAMTLRSYQRDASRPILFVPVYIGYERLLEGATYLSELRGAAKKKESIFDVFGVFKVLRQPFGKVWVNFGQPLSLTDFLNKHHPDWQSFTSSDDAAPWVQPASRQLARHISQRINQAVAINPVNLVATALLSSDRYALDAPTLYQLIDTYLALFNQSRYSEWMTLPAEQNSQQLVEHVAQLKLLDVREDALGKLFVLNDTQAVLMTYYRNNTLHAFALPALLCSFFHGSLVWQRQDLLQQVQALYPYIQAELFLPWSLDELPLQVERSLNSLMQAGLLHAEGDQLLRPERHSRAFVLLTLLAKPLLNTLQRFHMVSALLVKAGPNQITTEQLAERSTVLAERLSLLHELNAPEFFDRRLFDLFIQTLKQEGLLKVDDTQRLYYDRRLPIWVEAMARRVLSAQVRLYVQQVTMHEDINQEVH